MWYGGSTKSASADCLGCYAARTASTHAHTTSAPGEHRAQIIQLGRARLEFGHGREPLKALAPLKIHIGGSRSPWRNGVSPPRPLAQGRSRRLSAW